MSFHVLPSYDNSDPHFGEGTEQAQIPCEKSDLPDSSAFVSSPEPLNRTDEPSNNGEFRQYSEQL